MSCRYELYYYTVQYSKKAFFCFSLASVQNLHSNFRFGLDVLFSTVQTSKMPDGGLKRKENGNNNDSVSASFFPAEKEEKKNKK